MEFFPDVMPPGQQQVLGRLGPFSTMAGFYLAGGTAVAIHLGHRRSVDLDWFTEAPIPDPMRLAADLRGSVPEFEVTETAPGTLHGRAAGVKVSFIEYRYPNLVPPVVWADFQCRLAGLEDLACMKLSAISSRGAKKDFLDLYALVRSGYTLEGLIRLYQRKYSISDVGHVLMSLAYFDDAEAELTPEMLLPIRWPEVRQNIEKWVRDLARRAAPDHRRSPGRSAS